MIATPFYIWNALVMYGVSFRALGEFFLNITTISFWCRNGAPAWYMAFVVVTYAFFPLLYNLKKKHKYILVLLIILSITTELLLKFFESPVYILGERLLSRIPIFLIGMMAADLVKGERRVTPIFTVLNIVLAAMSFVYITFNYVDVVVTRYLYIFISIAIILVLSFVIDKAKGTNIIKPIIKMLNFCGMISLEIYLIHTFIIRIISHYNIWGLIHKGIYYIVIFAASVLLSVMVNKLSMHIVESTKQI